MVIIKNNSSSTTSEPDVSRNLQSLLIVSTTQSVQLTGEVFETMLYKGTRTNYSHSAGVMREGLPFLPGINRFDLSKILVSYNIALTSRPFPEYDFLAFLPCFLLFLCPYFLLRYPGTYRCFSSCSFVCTAVIYSPE